MNYFKFAAKLPLVVSGIVGIVNMVKNASPADKREAVRAAVESSLSLAEFVAEKDLLKDDVVQKLYSAYIDAEHAVAQARDALKAGLVAAKESVNK